jgi:hypothetical protein
MTVTMKSLKVDEVYVHWVNTETGERHLYKTPGCILITSTDEASYLALATALKFFNGARAYCNQDSTKYMKVENRGGAKELIALFSAIIDIFGEAYAGLEYEFMRTNIDFIKFKVKMAKYIQ